MNKNKKLIFSGAGVDGMIHEAAGPQLKEACRRLNECEPGDAKITGAFEIKGIDGFFLIFDENVFINIWIF